MPGSSFVRLDDGQRSVLFSGDIGRPQDLVMRPPVTPDAADYLVVESTYGDRTHLASDPLTTLGDVIQRTAARGGVVVIPAFAVGRAQALMYAIHLLKARGLIHNLPVYLNSPMAARPPRSTCATPDNCVSRVTKRTRWSVGCSWCRHPMNRATSTPAKARW